MNQSIRVHKYGGSSVATKEQMSCIAQHLSTQISEKKFVVVVSAMGNTTNEILKQARSQNITSKKQIDSLLSQGENTSAQTFQEVLEGEGVTSCVLGAFDIPIRTSEDFGRALIQSIRPQAILKALEHKDVVIVPGFQGCYQKDVTTLGRGGSDLTAVALSICLGVEPCEIYTDVEGVMTTDPKLYDKARVLDHVTYEEMIAFSYAGAKVLQPRCVVLAKRYLLPIVVRSSTKKNQGTWVGKREKQMENMIVSGVALKPKQLFFQCRYTPEDQTKVQADLTNHQAHILSYKSDDQEVLIEALIDISSKPLLEGLADQSKNISVKQVKDVARVSIIGSGFLMERNLFFDVQSMLRQMDIAVYGSYQTDEKITVLVHQDQGLQTVRALHDHFGLEKEPN